MRIEKIGENFTLVCGDALEFMRGMNNSVDLTVTDPPYKLTSGGNTTGEMGGCFSHDQYDNSGSIVDCDIEWIDFMPLIFQVMNRGHVYTMCNNRNVLPMLLAAEQSGFGYHNLLIWDKITATPNRWYMKNCEFTGLFFKDLAKYINDCSSKQLLQCPQVDETSHPTEKPVMVMQHYIENSSQRNEVVFDPFMGSGTTGVAAAKAGRSFLGVEKNELFFEIAVKRISRAVERGPDQVFTEFLKPKQVPLMELPRMKRPK